ncbi:MAG: 3-phosphoglycerate dehydrogenase, partial [Clostridia bacterium]|nr:3-phosphoglycerate dehydrogenase [Clostridia bacterium]
MKSIKLMNKIAKVGTDIFDRSVYNVAEDVANADAIMVRSAALHEMEFNPELEAIARCGAGVNNIPVEKCTENGVVVFNTPGANANGVKELAI